MTHSFPSLRLSDLVLFRLNRPRALFLSQMAAINGGAGAILHPSSVDAQGQWRTPVATGPYRLVEWKRGDSIHLEAFPEYVPRTEPRRDRKSTRLNSSH